MKPPSLESVYHQMTEWTMENDCQRYPFAFQITRDFQIKID